MNAEGYAADFVSIKQFDKDKWNDLLRFLFDELNVCLWNKEYIDTNVRDGTEWCLGITYTDQSTFSSEGSNEYGTFSLTSYDR